MRYGAGVRFTYSDGRRWRATSARPETLPLLEDGLAAHKDGSCMTLWEASRDMRRACNEGEYVSLTRAAAAAAQWFGCREIGLGEG